MIFKSILSKRNKEVILKDIENNKKNVNKHYSVSINLFKQKYDEIYFEFKNAVLLVCMMIPLLIVIIMDLSNIYYILGFILFLSGLLLFYFVRFFSNATLNIERDMIVLRNRKDNIFIKYHQVQKIEYFDKGKSFRYPIYLIFYIEKAQYYIQLNKFHFKNPLNILKEVKQNLPQYIQSKIIETPKI